jgi:hypothetical protein
MSDSEPKSDVLTQRLCSEIQLFDLCDLDSCLSKNGRFCTDPALLGRFEKIADDELRAPERYVSEEIDDAEADESDNGDYDDKFAAESGEGGEGGDDAGWEDGE